MKKTITTILFSFILAMSYGQKSQDIVGNWKFRKLKISNQNCKDFDHLTISAFTFADNGKAVFKHSRGTAEASYKLENNIIKLFDLSENGVKQEGSAQFLIKRMTSKTLVLEIEPECGNVDLVFKKDKALVDKK